MVVGGGSGNTTEYRYELEEEVGGNMMADFLNKAAIQGLMITFGAVTGLYWFFWCSFLGQTVRQALSTSLILPIVCSVVYLLLESGTYRPDWMSQLKLRRNVSLLASERDQEKKNSEEEEGVDND